MLRSSSSILLRPSLLQHQLKITLCPRVPITSISCRNFTMANPASSLPSTMTALQIQSQGDLSVLETRDIPLPKLKPGEVLIQQEYAGVNFIDTYQRGGLYKLPTLPWILGNESSGRVAALAPDVEGQGIEVGDSVSAYMTGGGFAQYGTVSRDKVVKLPSGVDTKVAAAGLLQGLTAWTLVKEAYPLQRGDTVLVHAAAGGVGLLLCQMASHLGATVIGTVSTEAKAKLAKENGAHHIINYAQESIVDKVLALTDGNGVQGIYDGVGKDTWEDDFKVIARKGTICTFGNASGAIDPFPPLKLAAKNVKVIRPTLPNYVHTREEMETYSKDFFDLLAKGVVKIQIHDIYPLSTDGIRRSQEDITSRKTTGKLLVDCSKLS